VAAVSAVVIVWLADGRTRVSAAAAAHMTDKSQQDRVMSISVMPCTALAHLRTCVADCAMAGPPRRRAGGRAAGAALAAGARGGCM
jgi:hypothetical protein